jgi:Golgi phosphoprotein 3 (GPP34)
MTIVGRFLCTTGVHRWVRKRNPEGGETCREYERCQKQKTITLSDTGGFGGIGWEASTASNTDSCGRGRVDRRAYGSLWGLASVRAVLLAEDLLLLLTDDTSGRLSTATEKAELLLAGANLVELALMGRVDVSPEVKPVRLIVRGRSPIGDAVLDATPGTVIWWQGWQAPAIDVIWHVIGESDKTGRKPLYERLVGMGLVRHERRRILGDRWPAEDSRHKVQMRGRVIQPLSVQMTPDTRSAALIALLHPIGHEPVIVDPRLREGLRSPLDYQLSRHRKDLLKRGAEIANGNWAPEAVRDSIDAIIAAIGQLARPARQGGDGDGVGDLYFGNGNGNGN